MLGLALDMDIEPVFLLATSGMDGQQGLERWFDGRFIDDRLGHTLAKADALFAPV
jgi:hypothetical protein